MTLRLTIGIDPGLSGAIAVLADGRYVEVHDMPTVGRGAKGRQAVNAAALANLLRGVRALHPGADVQAVIEDVAARPGQGVSSMYRFGHAAGVVEGVVAAQMIPMTKVTPQAWKKRAGLVGKDKDAARSRAIQLWPRWGALGKKGEGQALADAALIARFGAAE